MTSNDERDVEQTNRAMNRPEDIRKRRTAGIEDVATRPAAGAAVQHARAGGELSGDDAMTGSETRKALERATRDR